LQKGKVVGKGKVIVLDKGKGKTKKLEETKPVEKPKITTVDKGKDKVTQINKDTVYLEDVMKPR
jgi:hypothetical protein